MGHCEEDVVSNLRSTGRSMNKKRLAVIADDFTGALDTGIQFAKKGIRIEVLSGCADRIGDVGADVEVLVFDTQSRHIPPNEAYQAVYKAVEKSIAAGRFRRPAGLRAVGFS